MSKLTCLLLQQYYLHLNIFVKNKYIEWNVHEKDSGIFICKRNIKPIYIILTKQVTFQSFLNNIGIWEKINIHLCCVNYATTVADLRGGAPLRTKMFSISCSFSENLAKSYVGAPPPPGGLAPPPTGNPGSAPGQTFWQLCAVEFSGN